MSPLFQRASAAAIGSVTNVFTDRPWSSKTVRLAFLIVVIGMAFWIRSALYGASGIEVHQPIPGYVRVCVSYIGGFLIGWAFRRFVKLLFLAAVLTTALVGAAKFAGCDASSLRARIGHESEAVKEKAEHERDYLRGRLPSAAAAGIGVFWGFWRRSRGSASAPPADASGPNPPAPGKIG